MFGKLKDKLKGFFSKEEKEKPKEEKKKKESKKKEKASKKSKKETKKTKPKKKEKTIEEKLKEEVEKIDKQAPVKFDNAIQGYIPDEEKLKEELEEKTEEHKKEQEKPQEKKSFFSKFIGKIQTSTIKKEHVDELFQELELILLENNVALEVVDKIHENLEKDLIGVEVKKGKIEETIKNSLKESISSVLLEPPNLIENIKKKLTPYVIIFFGINGTGKTTSIAKLAHKLKKEKISCVLAAGDTFRAASIEQLETHANKLQVPIIKSQYNADPTSVAFDAVKYAEKNKIQCVLIDTAGRMYTKENLIKQMEKIIRVIKPDLKIFVGESITGNDAISQVQTFNDAIGIDGIILSKADVDEKGGTALSVSHVTKKPIYFLGTGQQYSDLENFKKETILKNLGLD